MGIFYQKYVDCSKEHSDFYVNTPGISVMRNSSPYTMQFEWAEGIDPSNVIIEFSRYDSMIPYQEYRTITTRGSLGTYTKYFSGSGTSLAHTVEIPHGAQNFRLRFNKDYPFVSRTMKAIPNNKIFIDKNGQLYQLYA